MGSHIRFTSALVLLSFASFATASLAHPQQEARSSELAGDATWEELESSFEAEHQEWKARVRAAEGGRERSAVRREDPTPYYAAAFEALADSGEIRAIFWLVDHLYDLGLRSTERKERRLELYERMIREHGASELLGEGMARVYGDSRLRREQGLETVERLTATAMQALKSEAARDSLRLGLARCSSKSHDAEATGKAVALLDAVLAAKHLPADELEQASNLRFELLHLRVGCPAPDFEGQTVDGTPVRLSDHAGKVVVLDFFGFW